MKKITFFALILSTILFAGCEKKIMTFDSSAQVEFKPIAATLAKGTTATPGTTTVLVQLIGAQQSSAITVPYTVDPTSTAVAGTHYTLSTSGTITIPANSSSGSLVVTAIPANVTSAKKLILLLSDGGSTPVSQNYKKCTITIQ